MGLAAAAEGGTVAGYVCASQGFGEAEILVLGVDPAFRRRGLARALLQALTGALKARGCDTVFLEVRRSNAAAVALYLSAGFREIGMRKGYYADSGEDALLLRRG
jgi:ribosomal-protein-alanine N-acetyltransferase